MVNMLQAREIKQAAAAAGFDLCGICRVRNFSAEQTFFEGWTEDWGICAGMWRSVSLRRN